MLVEFADKSGQWIFLGHLDIWGDRFLQKGSMWTFGVILGPQSSARTALCPSRPQRLIRSSRRSYIPSAVTVSIMSPDVFIQKFLSMFLADSTMDSHFSLEIREQPLKSIISVWEPCFRMVIESPQQRHVSLDT